MFFSGKRKKNSIEINFVLFICIPLRIHWIIFIRYGSLNPRIGITLFRFCYKSRLAYPLPLIIWVFFGWLAIENRIVKEREKKAPCPSKPTIFHSSSFISTPQQQQQQLKTRFEFDSNLPTRKKKPKQKQFYSCSTSSLLLFIIIRHKFLFLLFWFEF